MKDSLQSRREFLAGSGRAATAGLLALELSWLAALASCARDDAQIGATFTHLSASEARTMRAFAAQVIPSNDDGPGAEEAGALYFIDRAFGMPFFADNVPLVRAGLADLDARARTLDKSATFATLSSAQQASVMQRVEREPYFAAARTLVVIGTFADPSYGGNRDSAGWTLLGIDHRPSYAAPFGWYDAQTRGATNAA